MREGGLQIGGGIGPAAEGDEHLAAGFLEDGVAGCGGQGLVGEFQGVGGIRIGIFEVGAGEVIGGGGAIGF